MALDAAIKWEVRSTATAANANGGGFKTGASGTDFSQQDAAQFNLTGATSAGADAIILHASAAATMVGNIANVVSGTNATAGRYEITAVDPGVSITVDRNWGTGAVADGVVNIGGALSLGSSDDAIFEAMVAGNKMWVKSGTYTLGGTVTIAKAGDAQKPITVEGYATTRGDSPKGTTRPKFDCGAAVFTGGANWDWNNLYFTGSAAGTFTPGANNRLSFCKVENTSTTATRVALTSGANTLALGCELVSYRGTAVVTGSSINLIGCHIHDSNIGILHNSTSAVLTVFDCLIVSNVTYGLSVSAANTVRSIVLGNTFYGAENKLGVGVDLVTGVTNLQLVNNIFYGFTTAVVHADASQTIGYDAYNNYYNNTADVNGWVKGVGVLALDPDFANVAQVTGTQATTGASGVLTDAAADFSAVTDNQDFIYVSAGTGVVAAQYLITAHTATTVTTSPNIAADATADKVYRVLTGRNFAPSASMRAVGFPGAFSGSNTTSSLDIGGVQRLEAGQYVRGHISSNKFG